MTDRLSRIRTDLRRLSLDQAKQLYLELGELIQQLETTPIRRNSNNREVVQTEHIGNVIYQLEYIRCGKVGCKCDGEYGEFHGPYWYAYWREDNKLRSKYVGKKLKVLADDHHP
jgi:hypothetical protein